MDAQVADLPGAVRTMSQAEALPVPGPAPFALVGVEYVKHVAALVCAGAVLLVGPLGSNLADGWDAESALGLLRLVAGLAVIALLGHALPAWRLGRVSWPRSLAGLLAVWSAGDVGTGVIDGSGTSAGELVLGLLVVVLPVTLLALGLRALIPPWRPDPRLRPDAPR
ncbi:major facilitator transporter [Cellulomonas gilvus ATCC 13127]|uniref:Major facilitator transporter n=2 Tax=Cellulomonas gilvus TaxID=11 RepID=F8A768_CELGA|nr:major facilitator transporter [Cellulomonas gilvus ATCC 13127]